MLKAIPDFSAVRVLVVGDVMLDRYLFGTTSRISPEAPVPVVHVGRTEQRAGGAGNVAVNTASLGAQSTLAGLVGKDEEGGALAQLVREHGVTPALLELDAHPTISKLRVISKNQQLIRLDFETDVESTSVHELVRRVGGLLAQHDVVILSDYGKGALRQVETLIGLCREAGKPVLVDPKGSDYRCYTGATVITPNMHEFEQVVGECETEQVFEDKARALVEQLQLQALLVTRSEKGMCLIEAGSQVYRLPTNAKEVYDVTGAGDTVISTFAVSLAAGLGLQQASLLANLAAGLVVAKLGTASVSRAELDIALHGEAALSRKIVDQAALLEQLAIARHQGERVVMTNGCFDILHAGHIKYLQEAKQLGSVLVVAVNSDDSVRRLKGESRPLNSLADRMALLSALEAVDWVVPFSEDTPERLICSVRPDVLVKGGDYQVEQIAGFDCVTANGGEVAVLKYHEGLSTTELIEKARS